VSWSVAYNSELAIVEVTLVGRLDRADRIAANEEAFSSANAHDTRKFLLDATAYEAVSATVEIFQLAESYSGEVLPPARIAVIQPASKKAQEDAEFYATVCANRGWNARLFPGRSEAIEWLLAK
jgi:hypothetical protein